VGEVSWSGGVEACLAPRSGCSGKEDGNGYASRAVEDSKVRGVGPVPMPIDS
jgi:hypothetical protein